MRKRSFTLVEIMIVVAIIGLLAAIAIPSFIKARETSQKNACINNLRQIKSAWNQIAINENKTDTTTDEVNDYLDSPNPTCPTEGTAYELETDDINADPECPDDIDGHVLPSGGS
ncbi:MAG: competence type IV pilus major pilin ComGC [Verrucomicrobiota bacterium]